MFFIFANILKNCCYLINKIYKFNMETLVAFQANHHLTNNRTTEFVSNLTASSTSSSSTSSSSSSLSSPLSSLSEESKESFLEEKHAHSELNKYEYSTVDISSLSKISDNESSLKLIGKETVYNSLTKSLSNSINYLRKRSIFKSDPAIVKINDKNSKFDVCPVKKNLKSTNSSIQIGSIEKCTSENNTIVASKSVIGLFY